ncbi:hypothetical protein ACHAXS_006625 [Conticribra weissflogii]
MLVLLWLLGTLMLMTDVALKKLPMTEFITVALRKILSIQRSLDRITANRGCLRRKFLWVVPITTIDASGTSLFHILICAIVTMVESKMRMLRKSNLEAFLPIPLPEHGMFPYIDLGIFGITVAGVSVAVVPKMLRQNFLLQYHGIDHDETLIVGEEGNDIADIRLIILCVRRGEDGHENDGEGRRGSHAAVVIVVVLVGMRGFFGFNFFGGMTVAVAVDKTIGLFLFGVVMTTTAACDFAFVVVTAVGGTIRIQSRLDIIRRMRRKFHVGLDWFHGVSIPPFRAIGLGRGRITSPGPATTKRGRRGRAADLATITGAPFDTRRRRRGRRDIGVDGHAKSHV